MENFTEEFKEMLTAITDQINTLKYNKTQKDSPNPPNPTNVVPTNRKSPTLDGGKSTKSGDMWNLKHYIRSQIFYEIFIKTELKGDTAMDLIYFCNHIKMCINAVTRLR